MMAMYQGSATNPCLKRNTPTSLGFSVLSYLEACCVQAVFLLYVLCCWSLSSRQQPRMMGLSLSVLLIVSLFLRARVETGRSHQRSEAPCTGIEQHKGRPWTLYNDKYVKILSLRMEMAEMATKCMRRSLGMKHTFHRLEGLRRYSLKEKIEDSSRR